MAGSGDKEDRLINRQNISYYDVIAPEYDAILSRDSANAIIRAKVAARFMYYVKEGYVLDFGGGTGQDLEWLVQQHYDIIFCEPSAKMRQIAVGHWKNEFPRAPVFFLDNDKTDFRSWNSIFPLNYKVKAVLANFAVINCIPDIGLLFEKLAIVTETGGIVIAVLLDNRLVKRMKSNLKGTLQSLFSGKPVNISIDYNGERQLVYIHTMKAIKKSLADSFVLWSVERFNGFGFCLIHLVRK
jgi:SAM-dependent methyltransferase